MAARKVPGWREYEFTYYGYRIVETGKVKAKGRTETEAFHKACAKIENMEFDNHDVF